MELKQIEITNFLSYFGENKIEFSPMTTIFVGQNNTGKSKLFDAINFVLYGRIYDTQKEIWETNDAEVAELILNKHKINEALKKRESEIIVTVKLIIDNNDKIFDITRSVNYKLVGKKIEYVSKTMNFTELDAFDGHAEPYLGSDASDRIKQYFPETIKDFFLFQGEAASKIMQLQKGGNFRRAVREIARLAIFEEAKDMANKYENYVSNRLTRKVNKSKQEKDRQISLQSELDGYNDELKNYERKRDEAADAVAEYSGQLEALEIEAASLKEFEQYFNKKKTLEANRKKIEGELNSISADKSTIAEEAVFYKVREKINNFKNFYSRLEEKGEVPPSISISEIKKALDCCQCTICGTDLSIGTAARKFAENRLPKCDTDKLGDYLRSLNNTMADVCEDVLKIPDSLEALIRRKTELEAKKTQLRKEKDELQEVLDSMEVSNDSSTEKMQRLNEIRGSLRNYESLLDTAKAEKNKAEGSINVINNKIKQKRQELNALIVEDDDIDEHDKILRHYSGKINSAMSRLFDIANKTAYEGVQERANQYYKEMTEDNAALVGDIKIDIETSEIYTVDEQNNRIRNINQGNRISMQLAVIAGILTIAQEQFGVQYPFVTDAPVSALGGDNKLSTIQTMIKAFEQSVIVIKDDTSSKNKTNDELRKLIAESADVGLAYELSLCEAETVSDQYTVVKKIKG